MLRLVLIVGINNFEDILDIFLQNILALLNIDLYFRRILKSTLILAKPSLPVYYLYSSPQFLIKPKISYQPYILKSHPTILIFSGASGTCVQWVPGSINIRCVMPAKPDYNSDNNYKVWSRRGFAIFLGLSSRRGGDGSGGGGGQTILRFKLCRVASCIFTRDYHPPPPHSVLPPLPREESIWYLGRQVRAWHIRACEGGDAKI